MLAELKVSLEKAESTLEVTKDRLEKSPENIKLKNLYIQHAEEFNIAKTNYVGFYENLIIKLKQLCDEGGLMHLCSQFITENITPKTEVSAPLSVAIATPFKKAWTLVEANEDKEEARKLFKQLIGLHPYAAQGLVHCSTDKEEIESALLESIKMKLALWKETGLLRDLQLLCDHQNTRDVNLLLRAAQYYRNKFNESKNPLAIYNAICVGTMMPKCQEGTSLLNQIALLNITSKGNSQNSSRWLRNSQSIIDKEICYMFMNFCRNQENIQSLKVFLQNNNFEGDWYLTKDELFFVQQLVNMEGDKEFWSHRANLNILQKISDSSEHSDKVRLLAAEIKFNSTVDKNFDTSFDYYKILKEFKDKEKDKESKDVESFKYVERSKYIGILHKIANRNIQTHPEQLYKLATKLGYALETLPMFIKAADAGCKEALSAIESHDIFLTAEDLRELTLFFARHNSVKGIRNLHKNSNNNAFLVIARGLEEHSQPFGTFEIPESYPPPCSISNMRSAKQKLRALKGASAHHKK